MNPVAQQKLVELIKRFGADVARDPRRCEALLRDLCGDQHRREVHVLVCAVRDGIVTELLGGGNGTPPTVLWARLVSRLHNNYGIAMPLAQWGVHSWALALGVVNAHELEVMVVKVAAIDQLTQALQRGCAFVEEYLVVDLSSGPTASNYPISCLSAVPCGGWADEYKTTKMVLRRIPAGTFIMGSPMGELLREIIETQHQVTLTHPFYIGIFEVTQKQWERVMGTWPSFFKNVQYRDTRPVEQVRYDDIRGSKAGTGWPFTSKVDADSFMGRLRARTGQTFDLPTESQWEYAGRAGTTTALNSGKNLTSVDKCPNLAEVGRYSVNGGWGGDTKNEDTSVGTAKVGSYVPNTWGLYDIHGNVLEWCLDWADEYPSQAVTDPLGPLSGSFRIRRGGCWTSSTTDKCRVGCRSHNYSNSVDLYGGGRVVMSIGQ